MPRKHGTKAKIRELKARAFRMEGDGKPLHEIAEAVDRSKSTVYRWLQRKRGKKKPPTKAVTIRDLHRKGRRIPEIIRESGASNAYVYRILEDREDKQERISAEEQVEDLLVTGKFPKRDPKDAFGWCLLGRLSEIIDNDGVDGLELSLKAVEHYRSQMVTRKTTRRRRSARCLATQFMVLWGAANRVTANLRQASQAIERARDLSCYCTDCLPEIDRQCGWFHYHLWSDSRNTQELSTSITYFTRSLNSYQEMFPKYGHCVYKNGISAALFGRSASRYYAREFKAGLSDSQAAVELLDPKKSPNLIVRCSHGLAVFLAETGRQEDLAEAATIVARIQRRMPEEGTIPHAKVIWLSGLLEEHGEGQLLDARDIFIEKGYAREVGTITLDLVAYYGDRERQIQAIESLVNPYNLGVWLEGELRGVAEVLSAARERALTLELIREARAKIGADVMPDLLWRRRALGTPAGPR